MRILVTGGAGFIGSHTCDRLVERGHDVTVLDALVAPTHAGGRADYLTPGVELIVGDVRDRGLMASLLRRVEVVFHLAAHQGPSQDFARFADVNVTSTALIYQIVATERLELARVVVASSQAAAGEGLYLCPEDGEQLPAMRPEQALRQARWEPPCPACGGPLQHLPTPERVARAQSPYGMSKSAQELAALNLGASYGVPTVALRYSIVQGPRQSARNPYSGACRIFCLHYEHGTAPPLFEDGRSMRDYVAVSDVVDANELAMGEDRAVGRVLNVGGGHAYSTAALAEIVRRHYGAAQPAHATGEYRLGDTRHAVSDIAAIRDLGWTPTRTPEDSVADYAEWLKTTPHVEHGAADAAIELRRSGLLRAVGARCAP